MATDKQDRIEALRAELANLEKESGAVVDAEATLKEDAPQSVQAKCALVVGKTMPDENGNSRTVVDVQGQITIDEALGMADYLQEYMREYARRDIAQSFANRQAAAEPKTETPAEPPAKPQLVEAKK